MKRAKLLNTIGVAASIFGGLIILMAVGAVDCDTYTMGQALERIAVGAAILLCGLLSLAAAKV